MKASGLSLKKSDILRGYKVFSRVIAEGQALQRGTVRCFIMRDAQCEHSLRAGFSVSRSVRNAADRNRARRWMKESYRKNKALIMTVPTPAVGAVFIVFLCTAQARAIHNAKARSLIEQSTIALLGDLHSQFSGKP